MNEELNTNEPPKQDFGDILTDIGRTFRHSLGSLIPGNGVVSEGQGSSGVAINKTFDDVTITTQPSVPIVEPATAVSTTFNSSNDIELRLRDLEQAIDNIVSRSGQIIGRVQALEAGYTQFIADMHSGNLIAMFGDISKLSIDGKSTLSELSDTITELKGIVKGR